MALDKDDIKQLIAILQKGLSDEDETETQDEVQKEENGFSNIKTKTSKIQHNTTNKFLELGFDRLHKEDIAIDKALQKKPPTPRRRKLSTINVRCRVCGKQESISSSLLYESPDRYKCNKCCASPG